MYICVYYMYFHTVQAILIYFITPGLQLALGLVKVFIINHGYQQAPGNRLLVVSTAPFLVVFH